MDIGQIRQSVANMQDCTFTASNGAKVTIDCSLLRSMTPQETRQRRASAERVWREMCAKYGVRPAGGDGDAA